MDNLQYISTDDYLNDDKLERFKPYYKWITFNTLIQVLADNYLYSFKPYYKWITFNTVIAVNHNLGVIDVLNLIING